MKQREVLTTLNRGELGPTFYGRFDTPIYTSGVKEMRNFIALREGGATTYPGSDYIGDLNGRPLLQDFVISPGLAYLLVFTAGHLAIWKYGTANLAIDILTPYTEGDLPTLRFAQNGSWLIITTKAYPPKLLEYLGADSFSTTGGGALVDFTDSMEYTPGRQPFIGAGNYPAVCTFYQGRAWFFSSANEPEKFWASCPFLYKRFVYYETIATTSKQIKNPDTQVFIGTTVKDSTTISVSQDLSAKITTSHYIYGPGVPDGTKVISVGVNAIVVSKAATSAGTDLGFNAMLWVTSTPEYETVTTTRDVVTDASAIEAELASDQNDTILWAVARKDLVIGTTTSEWVIPSGVTAINLAAELHTRNGSADCGVAFVGDAILFPMGNARGIREYVYTQEGGGYQSPEMTFYAPHILSAGLNKIDWQNAPRGMVWVLLSDGTMAAATYERVYQINAWARINPVGAFVESLAVLPASSGDELFMAVNRSGTRTLERARQLFSAYQLDAAVKKTKGSGVVTGITHLTGSAYAHYAGNYYPITIVAGEVALPAEIPDGQEVDIGLQIESKISLLRPNAQSQYGTSQGRPVVINKIGARVLDSGKFKVGSSKGYEWANITYPFSGDVTVLFRGTWDTDGGAEIITTEPMTILNIFRELDAGG